MKQMRNLIISPALRATPEMPRVVLWKPKNSQFPGVILLALNFNDSEKLAVYHGWHHGDLIHMDREAQITFGSNLAVTTTEV